MSVSSINNSLKNNAFSNFNTNSNTSAMPQKTSEDKQKSNAYKYMLGATALAGIVALGIAGYKGHFGESVQKLLGGAEKEAGSIKPKASGSPKPEEVPTPKTENVVTENIEEAAPLSKEETIVPKEEITVPKEEVSMPKEKVAVPKSEEVPIVEKQAEQAEEQVAKSEEKIETTASEEVQKAEKAAEIVAAKLEDLVPKEMIGYMKMTEAEINKLPRFQDDYSEHIIETYSNGKPKYTIDCINYVRMYDEETGNVVKYLNSSTYYEYDAKIADRRLKYVSITPEGQINAISQGIKWDTENKILEQIWYELDGKTPSHLSEHIYDPETKKCVKIIGYKGIDRNSGVSYTLNYDRITGEMIK